MKTIQATMDLPTSPAVLWKAITDHQTLPRHVSILREVRVLGTQEEGVGTVRQCTLRSGKSFHERITAWEEERRYCYQPNTDSAAFPFSWAEACWSIKHHGDGSLLTYRLQYEPRSRLRDLVNYPLLRTYGVWQIRKMLNSYDEGR